MIAHAVVAPWICKIFGEKGQPPKLFHCQDCDFRFFGLRYSSIQVTKLYDSYRSDEYFVARSRWEPWYRKSENSLFNPEIGVTNILRRKVRMSNELKNANVTESFKNVLDYGGDTGQFFPENITGDRWLIDISGIESANHQIRITESVSKIPKKTLDLVMACMILEHLSSFTDFLADASGVMAPNGILYVELPLDSFTVKKWHKSENYRRYLALLNLLPPIFVLIDFISGVSRNYFRSIPTFGIVKQSEHINYFSQKSISVLLAIDFEVSYVSAENYDEKHGKFRLGFLAAIARKATPSIF